jgi:hypothetical protein
LVPGGLLERDRGLARIDGILTSARDGPCGLLLITGPAGIGKTPPARTGRRRCDWPTAKSRTHSGWASQNLPGSRCVPGA